MQAKGAKFAVLQGGPGQPGPYEVRLSVPAGYRVQPHWHSQAENVAVISGSVMIGMGDKWDAKALKIQKAGSFGSIPAKTKHFAMFKVPTVIQIHGEGPLSIQQTTRRRGAQVDVSRCASGRRTVALHKPSRGSRHQECFESFASSRCWLFETVAVRCTAAVQASLGNGWNLQPRAPCHSCPRQQSAADFLFALNACYRDFYRTHTPGQ